MRTPYNSTLIDDCLSCQVRKKGFFCELPEELLKKLETLKYTTLFPKGVLLFVEGQSPRGVFMLCTGRVKLSACSSDGKVIITDVAEAGQVLGLSAVISGQAYEVTAETLAPCQVNFIKSEDLLPFLSENNYMCLRVAEHLSNDYRNAHAQVCSLGLSHSTSEKLAKLILEWCAQNGNEADRGISLKLTLTHEEIAQIIGTSRETVTRLFGEFKHSGVVHIKGSTLIVRNKAALEEMVNS